MLAKFHNVNIVGQSMNWKLTPKKKKTMEFGFNFLKWGIWLFLSFKKKWATLREKRRRKKFNNNEKIYRV
jgi:hypothetical protein